MSYAVDLLALAQSPPSLNTEAELRRSVSTAYYAVFHLIVDSAISKLIPDENTPAQNFARRVPTHTALKATCASLVARGGQATPIDVPKQWKEAGCSGPVDPALSSFAENVIALHAGRERADYDLGVVFPPLDAEMLLVKATAVFAAVGDGLPEPQWTLFLTTILLNPRRS